MLNEDEIDIYVVGDIDEENIIAKLQNVLRLRDVPYVEKNVTVEQTGK